MSSPVRPGSYPRIERRLRLWIPSPGGCVRRKRDRTCQSAVLRRLGDLCSCTRKPALSVFRLRRKLRPLSDRPSRKTASIASMGASSAGESSNTRVATRSIVLA